MHRRQVACDTLAAATAPTPPARQPAVDVLARPGDAATHHVTGTKRGRCHPGSVRRGRLSKVTGSKPPTRPLRAARRQDGARSSGRVLLARSFLRTDRGGSARPVHRPAGGGAPRGGDETTAARRQYWLGSLGCAVGSLFDPPVISVANEFHGSHRCHAQSPSPPISERACTAFLPITIGFTVVSVVIASRAERPIPHAKSAPAESAPPLVGGSGMSGGGWRVQASPCYLPGSRSAMRLFLAGWRRHGSRNWPPRQPVQDGGGRSS